MQKVLLVIGISGLVLGCPLFASAHGVSKVRKDLLDQGYEDLDFQRKKPPFKLDACQDDKRYHLHVDFYGKIIKRTAIGECEGVNTDASRDGNDDGVEDSDDKTVVGDESGENKITDEARSRAWRYWGKDSTATDGGN